MTSPNSLAKPEMEATLGLNALLEDEAFVKRIAAVEPELQRLLYQIQLDGTREDKLATAGPTCLALRRIQEVLILFAAKGAVIAAKEEKSRKKTK